jgi:hypothetical protein
MIFYQIESRPIAAAGTADAAKFPKLDLMSHP